MAQQEKSMPSMQNSRQQSEDDAPRFAKHDTRFKQSNTLEFVPQDGKPLASNDPRRKKVRAHVRRAANFKQRMSQKENEKEPRKGNKKENLVEQNDTSDIRMLVPKAINWGGMGKDPFHTLPIKAGEFELLLLNYYATTWHKVRIPINPARTYLPMAISDPALLHVTLLHAVMNSPLLSNPKFAASVTYHKLRAIELINEKIGGSPSCDANTLITVALLALLESADGSDIACQAHMDGLKVLTQYFGGLDNSDLHPLLRKTITWIDATSSMILHSPLIYSDVTPTDLWENIKFHSDILYNEERLIKSLHFLSGSYDLCQIAGAIYRYLRWLSDNINPIPASDIKRLEELDFSTRTEFIERESIKLRNMALESNNSKSGILIAFSNASLLYICLTLRGYGRRLSMIQVLAKRIKAAIESLDWSAAEQTVPDLLLWMLMLGGPSVDYGLSKDWFSRRLRSVSGSLGLKTTNEVALRVKSFLWVDSYVSREGLWEECGEGLSIEEAACVLSSFAKLSIS